MAPSLAQTLAALRSGQQSLVDYIHELEVQYNLREPDVYAFLPEPGRFDRLRRDAADLLAQYPEPTDRPPLFGLVVGVKDIFHVDTFTTRAGSQVPATAIQGDEARAVAQIKAAGALILGKTVTTEFAYFAPGPTRNPFNLEHTPGGSSSGSAAAVAAGLCPMAFGTQTIGSINRPAAFCGVVGYKPSYERISRAGVIPLAESVDHIGYFTHALADAAVVAPILCREWRPVMPGAAPVMGVPEGVYLIHASDEGLTHFNATCDRLTAAGLTIKRVEAMPDFDGIVARHQAIVAAEAALTHKAWFKDYGDLYHEKTRDLILKGQAVGGKELEAARAGRLQLRQQLTELMDEYGLDLWLSPPAPGAAPFGLGSTGDPIMNLPWTHSGLPTLSLPAGRAKNGLPLGLQLTGRFDEDERLFAQATAIDAVLNEVRG